MGILLPLEDMMNLDFFTFYAEATVVCVAILCILLINDNIHNTRQEKQIWFNRTVIAHILYFVSDVCWAGILSGNLPNTRFLVVFFNLLNYIILSLMAYEWFMYMAASENMPFRTDPRKRRLLLLPLVLSTLVIIIAYLCNPLFWISESGELNTLYYPLMIAAPTFYLVSAFVISMINAGKSNSKSEKSLYRLIGIYPLTVLLFGLIQTFMLNAPLFCFGCTIMMLFFYIQNIQALISVDSLTRLNNRGQIDRYMEQVRYKEGTKIYVMMIDIDRFKGINDTFGHAEGDRALILVSDTLKQSVGRIKASAFLGRYGGDEFSIFIQSTAEENIPEILISDIRMALLKKQLDNRLPYELKISVGYDFLKSKEDSLEACMIRADEMLYRNKRAVGAGR